MDTSATLDARSSAAELFGWVGSLDTYDRWLDIVPRTETAPAADGDPGPAWFVTLRGRIGPLARSKRLRMVRTVHEPPGEGAAGEVEGRAVFERREVDGRDHSAWVLTAAVRATADGSELRMDLHYGGSLWVPLLDRLLTGEIESSRARLRALVDG